MLPQSAAADNIFEHNLVQYTELTSAQPITNEDLVLALENLEESGEASVADKTTKLARFADVMHTVVSRVAELEVEPPLSEAQKKRMAGKVALYGQMMEAIAPKRGRGRTKPTDTKAIETDKPKP